MKNKIKNFMKGSMRRGGVETIVGVVLLVGIVVGLIIMVIVPMVRDANTIGNEAETDVGSIKTAIQNIN